MNCSLIGPLLLLLVIYLIFVNSFWNVILVGLGNVAILLPMRLQSMQIRFCRALCFNMYNLPVIIAKACKADNHCFTYWMIILLFSKKKKKRLKFFIFFLYMLKKIFYLFWTSFGVRRPKLSSRLNTHRDNNKKLKDIQG